MSAEQLRVAFTDIANADWGAGSIYYANLLTALRTLPEAERPATAVVVWRPDGREATTAYRDLADAVVDVAASESSHVRRSLPARAVRKLTRRPAPPSVAAQVLTANGFDVVFSCNEEFGPTLPVPQLGWITDFQHMHLPELFSDLDNHGRDECFARMAQNCARVVVSSHDAAKDFARFSPQAAHKARVLQFVSQVAPEVYATSPEATCRSYHLPERFVYLPNQFWMHKGHATVVEALGKLHARRPEITVVCTGSTADNRNPLHFAQLMTRVSELGVRDNFIVLGWVSVREKFDLMRQSVAVLQPSSFEGWSTTVEETKSLGKTIALSDIGVHREQDPVGALFFDQRDPDAIASALEQVYDTCGPGPDAEMESAARAALPARTLAYARTFMSMVREVAQPR